jgi:hypothetical protein
VDLEVGDLGEILPEPFPRSKGRSDHYIDQLGSRGRAHQAGPIS